MAAVYRALELPLPKTLPYASKELRNRFVELLARIMPFDLVIDEHTADGTEARISKTSVAGSWGAVAGIAPVLRRPVRGRRAPASRAPRSPTTWSGRTRGRARRW